MSTLLLAACAAAACMPTAGQPVPEQPASQAPAAPPAAVLPPETDLTGSWATGSGAEPAAARIVLHPECAHHPADWVIQQTGSTIEAWSFPARQDQGIVTRDQPQRKAAAAGTISGLDVVIVDGSSRYLLRYDPQSGHLRGTLDGKPFWAVRQSIVRTQLCPGVP